MRIFFTTPDSGKEQYQPFIDEVLTILRKNDVTIISPEDSTHYKKTIHQYESEGIPPERAHYTFVTHGIAEADAVIIEASHESLRVGHEATLALLYGKPTLVLSQKQNYADYIPHELLVSSKYETKHELKQIVKSFIENIGNHLSKGHKDAQTIEAAADSLRITAHSSMRQQALRDAGDFGDWARLAEKDPEKAYLKIQRALGGLPTDKAWSHFASIYNEDTPDYIFDGVTQLIESVFKQHGVTLNDPVIEAETHTGSISRNLHKLGYTDISAFSSSREMLVEGFRLCADIPAIKLFEANVDDMQPPTPAKAIAWVDFTSNFSLTPDDLKKKLQNLINQLQPGGCLLFDIRTTTGWNVSFFRQKITTYATPNFQRVRVGTKNHKEKLMDFDIFIRTKQNTGIWGDWYREQMRERMWSLAEVKEIVASLDDCKLKAIYGDDFSLVKDGEEPGLAYLAIVKHKD